MPAPGSVIGSASADFNGDGRDEAVFVIGRQLVCLRAGRTPAEGSVLWRLPLPAQTGSPSLAVLGRSEGLSFLLVGADGFVCNVRWERSETTQMLRSPFLTTHAERRLVRVQGWVYFGGREHIW